MTVTHPEFDEKTLKNDLMLIKLSREAGINSYVGTIAIAMEPSLFNDTCFIPTWMWVDYKNSKCLTTLCFHMREFEATG